MDKIVQRLQIRREQLKYSYQDLADKTGMSKSTLQRYESGKIQNIPLSKIGQLAEALQVSPAYLLGWDDIVLTPWNKEPSLLLDEKETIFIKKYRTLNHKGQLKLLEYLEDIQINEKYKKYDELDQYKIK